MTGATIDKLVRGVITLGLLGATIYLWIKDGVTPPAELLAFTGMAIGQYLPNPGSIGKE